MRVLYATDLGRGRGGDFRPLNLDRFPAPVHHAPDFIFLEGLQPWDMVAHAMHWIGQSPCPVCDDERFGGSRDQAERDPLDGGPSRTRRRSRKTYCLGCDRTGLDGKVEFAGLDVDSCPNPDWSATPTCTPDDGMLGGVEAKPTKVTSGIRRRRSA
jgi:hypothetical protein